MTATQAPSTTARDYRCTTCGATPGQPCRATAPGQPTPTGYHQRRIQRHVANL